VGERASERVSGRNVEAANALDALALREQLWAVAQRASDAIMAVYAQPFEVVWKPDHSPVTEADVRSQAVIAEGLEALLPGVPMLAEEGEAVPHAQRVHWPRFWCVDPLDGTRDFVHRTGEFSINIGLVVGASPVLGLLHAPVQALSYFGAPGVGAWRREGTGAWTPIHTQAPLDENWRVFTSRQHTGPETLAYIDALKQRGHVEVLRRGSAIKACLVADGSAHLYPRLGPTFEWDTAAAQAVVEGAGGIVHSLSDGRPLRYNKPDVRNPPFLVAWGPDAPKL
jgi:3'(2'), 5'-bisphosphate nucleotidase